MSVRSPRPSRHRRVIVCSIVLLAVAAATGCGASVADRAGVSPSTAGSAGTEGQPSASGASPTLPADFPTGISFPSGSYAISSVSAEEGVTTVVLEGTFDLDSELAHLVAGFEHAGYTVDQHTRAESGSIDQLYLELSDEEHTVSIAIINRPENGVATYEVTPAP